MICTDTVFNWNIILFICIRSTKTGFSNVLGKISIHIEEPIFICFKCWRKILNITLKIQITK